VVGNAERIRVLLPPGDVAWIEEGAGK